MPSDLKADLQRLVELQEKATEGPWENPYHRAEVVTNTRSIAKCSVSRDGYQQGHRDGDFICAARNTDFAGVLQRLEELESENQRLRERLGETD
jgi:hypothetical protein